MQVRVEERDGVRVLTLDRPPVNAVDLAFAREIGQALEAAAAAADCRAVVLTGAPPAFCAGVDVKAVPGYDAATRAEMIRCINRTILALYGMPKPSVAAVNGHAIGAGLVVALACDFRLAVRGSHRLGLTEVAAGIPYPAAPMVVVRAELDRNTARDLVLSGRIFGPADAVAERLLDAVVPGKRLVDAAVERAAAAAKLPAYAVVKQQLRAEALDRIQRIVATDDDPLLRGSLGLPTGRAWRGQDRRPFPAR
jgi:enoyl-CoA hydratase